MLKKLMVTVAAVTVMLVAFTSLMGVSKMDISAKNAMQRHVVAEPFEAGDIVELSADGQRIVSLLCRSNLSPDRRVSVPIDSVYYNIVDYSQAKFFDYLEQVKAVVGMAKGGPLKAGSPWELHFVGEVNRVIGGNLDAMLPGDCVCGVAKAVLESKSKACRVEKSLVETRLETGHDGQSVIRKTVGISFRDKPLIFYPDEALKALCPDLNTEAVAPKGQSCGGNSGFSFDVVARAKIGLIREAP